jgi:hypothetical protein
VNLVEQFLEQVEPAVDVPDSIGMPPPSAGGAAFPSWSEIEHSAAQASIFGRVTKSLRADTLGNANRS